MQTTKTLGMAIACLCLAALGAALQGGGFKDKAGNMEVRQIKSWRIQPEGTGKIRFIGSGAPKLKGTWKLQGLTVEAGTLDALATADAKNAYSLTTATMGGGVTIVRRSKPGDDSLEATINSKTATYSATESRIDADGGVVVDSVDKAKSQIIHATGSSGTIHLAPSATQTGMISKATMSGPVTMNMQAVREAEENGVKKRIPFTIKGSGDRLDYDAKERTILLKGHVRLSGDDPVLTGAEVEASSALVKLTATGEIESIDFDGDPGKTIVGEPGGGGRRP